MKRLKKRLFLSLLAVATWATVGSPAPLSPDEFSNSPAERILVDQSTQLTIASISSIRTGDLNRDGPIALIPAEAFVVRVRVSTAPLEVRPHDRIYGGSWILLNRGPPSSLPVS